MVPGGVAPDRRPDSPPRRYDLSFAGKEVFVRKSSAHYERLVELNQRFAADNMPQIKLKEAPDELEDEDLINCGPGRVAQ